MKTIRLFTGLLVVLILTNFVFAQNSQTEMRTVTIPAGSRLLVKTSQSLKSDNCKAGERFTTTLETDLVINNIVAAPKGCIVYGRVVEV